MRVLRYPLRLDDYQNVEVAAPGTVLSVQWRSVKPRFTALPMDQQGIDMWCAAADADVGAVPTVVLRVWIVGTNTEAPIDDIPHVGTVVTPGGYVWHVFARRIEAK